MKHVLLYYKFVDLQHPENIVRRHKEVCKALQLKGRILISKDGINGTVGGSKEAIKMYKDYMNQHQFFKDIDFKESTSEFNPFPRLSVKEREELVTTEVRDEINICNRAQHIKPKTLHKWLEKDQDDLVLLDMRNDYEWEIGRFKDAVRPPMKYFRDLKESMEFYEQYKGKKIVMFCTGGIRCEPASAWFIENGFDPNNLYQLEGGIMKYVDKYGSDGFYVGKCFVFDDRMAITVDDNVLSDCDLCGQECDVYRNCKNRKCNKLFIGCESCMREMKNTCSDECCEYIQDPENQRPPAPNHVEEKHRNKGVMKKEASS